MSDKRQAQIKSEGGRAGLIMFQRSCACGQHIIGGGTCNSCQNRNSNLQRSAVNPAPATGVPSIVHEVVHSPGQPLDRETRAFFEPRFGHDFSQVRVHADAHAAKSARSVNALAYTVGQDLVFGSQQYAPHTDTGRRLIAHELTHVVQQGFQRSSNANAVRQSNDSSQEREAETVAEAVPSLIAAPNLLFTQAPHTGTFLQRSNGGDRNPSRESRPKDAPRGTRPIDQSGLGREDIHEIKDGVGAGPRDWVGITPDGEVITSDEEGNAVNHGPASDYLREAHPEIPSWVWPLVVVVGIIVVIAIIACFATGVCEFAAVVGGLGYATALLIINLLRSAGIRDSGAEVAASEAQSEQSEDVA